MSRPRAVHFSLAVAFVAVAAVVLIALRTLQALRDLRLYAPPVIVQNAGQVNVAGQQVNVGG